MIQIGARPDAGFEDPIGMMMDCHRRIERFLDVLDRVAHGAVGREMTTVEAEAVAAALKYFEESGPRHNADEEESLFPRMRELARREPGARERIGRALEEIDRLEREHVEAGAIHAAVGAWYARWLRGEVPDEGAGRELAGETGKLRDMYSRHIQAEEELVFPLAAQVLDSAEIAAAGREVEARRR